MNNLKKIAPASVLALSSVAANAELISADWKNNGDNLITVDSQSGLEWLDLSASVGESYNLASVGELVGYEEWRVATHSEVTELLTNHFIGGNMDASMFSTSTVGTLGDEFHSFFGNTANIGFSYGLYMNDDGNLKMAGVNPFWIFTTNNAINYSHYANGNAGNGVHLVKGGSNTSVPVPATLGLLALAMAGLSFRRKSA